MASVPRSLEGFCALQDLLNRSADTPLQELEPARRICDFRTTARACGAVAMLDSDGITELSASRCDKAAVLGSRFNFNIGFRLPEGMSGDAVS